MVSERTYQVCSKCILDTNDYPDIIFDKHGICNICHIYDDLAARTVLPPDEAKEKLDKAFHEIRSLGKNKEYDCIVGVSGGVDSTYLAYVVKQAGLKPLIVHVDNGWNSELAVKNIENVLNKLGFDLYTYVINWEEIKDLQLAYLKASVIDIDIPTDNAFAAALFTIARKHNIKYILSGHNTVTEGWLPPNFAHYKLDTMNLRDIHRKFGKVKLKSFPTLGVIRYFIHTKLLGIKFFSPLNYIEYNKEEVKKFLIKELEWRDYGGKHYENIFTRFYQGYILPEKFHVDKRKAHYSTLICSGQITREQALEAIQSPPYDSKEFLQEDREYFIKKLGLTAEEFERIMKAPIQQHSDYRSYLNIYKQLTPLLKIYRKLRRILKKGPSAT